MVASPLMPNVLASLVMMWASSALRSSDLEGIQPTLRHTPPQYLGSTTAVFRPSWADRIAATYPPGPAPRTTTSKWVTRPTLVGNEPRQTAAHSIAEVNAVQDRGTGHRRQRRGHQRDRRRGDQRLVLHH